MLIGKDQLGKLRREEPTPLSAIFHLLDDPSVQYEEMYDILEFMRADEETTDEIEHA